MKKVIFVAIILVFTFSSYFLGKTQKTEQVITIEQVQESEVLIESKVEVINTQEFREPTTIIVKVVEPFESSISENISSHAKISVIKEILVGEVTEEIPGIFRISGRYSCDELKRECGSGFLVIRDGNKYFVTADHCIGFCDIVGFYRNSGEVNLKLGKHARDKNCDIFVAQAFTDEIPLNLHPRMDMGRIKLRGALYDKTEFDFLRVDIYGYPASSGFRKFRDVSKERIRFNESNSDFLITEGENEVVKSGMSGGPWIDQDTNSVVGVNSRSIIYDGVRSSAGVPVNIIHDMIDKLERSR